MTLTLSTATDAQINEAVALHVAGLIRCEKWGAASHPLMGVTKTDCGHENCYPSQFWPPDYLKVPNLLLPVLEAHTWARQYDGTVWVRASTGHDCCQRDVSLSKASCVAMLRAHGVNILP